MDANQKVSLATLGVLAIVAGAPLVQSCIGGQPPSRVQIEAAEDKFCAAVAKVRAFQKEAEEFKQQAETLDAGSSAGGSR